MRQVVENNLSQSIDPSVVRALMDSYQGLVAAYRKGDLDSCLNKAGKFVEHTLRSIQHIRTGSAPAEIRRPGDVVQEITKDKSLPEPLRILIPGVAHAMVYEIRSKRGAVHVKEIDPRTIDGALCVQSASWIVSEFLRLYHFDAEPVVM